MNRNEQREVKTRENRHIGWLKVMARILNRNEPGHFIAIGPGIPMCVGDKYFISRAVMGAVK